MNYQSMAMTLRDERWEMFREYAKAGYLPAWSKVLFLAMAVDMPLACIDEFHRSGDVLEQELRNPYGQGR